MSQPQPRPDPATPVEFKRLCDLYAAQVPGVIDGRAYIYGKTAWGPKADFIGTIRSDATVGELIEFFQRPHKGD